MRLIKLSKVFFAEDNVEREFLKLKDSDEIENYTKRAIRDIQKNAFFGVQVSKRIIPKKYLQEESITNLGKYDLPDGWRIVYSITISNKIEILSVILEWFNHPTYEGIFN
jgi:hypothetical protein